MKKIYILICALAISFSAIAQVASQTIHTIDYSKNFNQAEIIDVNEVINSNNTSSSAMQSIVWESDFSYPNDWLLDNNGQTLNGWSIDATTDSWYLPNFSSTSGGNFAELGN